MGRTQYTNPWVPEGHIHVSSPRDSTWVVDSGWVSKTSNLRLLPIFEFFNLQLLQSFNFFNLLTSSILNFFNLRFLQFFYFFNFWLYQTSTSWKLSFLQFSTSILWLPEIFGFLNLLSRWEWNVKFIFWCLPPTMDSKFCSLFFIDDLLEVNLYRVRDQRSRWE
jgi:hypothetical protein